jgi:hypothetical protein
MRQRWQRMSQSHERGGHLWIGGTHAANPVAFELARSWLPLRCGGLLLDVGDRYVDGETEEESCGGNEQCDAVAQELCEYCGQSLTWNSCARRKVHLRRIAEAISVEKSVLPEDETLDTYADG